MVNRYFSLSDRECHLQNDFKATFCVEQLQMNTQWHLLETPCTFLLLLGKLTTRARTVYALVWVLGYFKNVNRSTRRKRNGKNLQTTGRMEAIRHFFPSLLLAMPLSNKRIRIGNKSRHKGENWIKMPFISGEWPTYLLRCIDDARVVAKLKHSQDGGKDCKH